MKVSEIKIGETYNHIKVIKDLGRYHRTRRYLCQCLVCGKEYIVEAKSIGVSKCCHSCIHKVRAEEIIGTRCGRLKVTELAYKDEGKHCLMWLCKCDCGGSVILPTTVILRKRTLSCGCLQRDIIAEHGREYGRLGTKSVSRDFAYEGLLREHPNYGCWQSMLRRCDTPNAKNYHRYGGRGIKVCDRWLKENHGFENFVADMGIRPSDKHSLDRIDANGDYCPENCRWATMKEQENNKRNNIRVVLDGKSITITQLCEIIAINRNCIYKLLKRGIDINYILQVKLNATKNEKHYTEHINFNRNVDRELINRFLIKIQHNRNI